MLMLSSKPAKSAIATRVPVRKWLLRAASCSKLSTASSTSTFSLESQVPRLPVPNLHQTAERYIKSVQPWLTKSQFEKTAAVVHDFVSPNGFGNVLQERLFELEKSVKHSWLEKIWLDKAYLEYREPCYLNVNWYASISEPSNVHLRSFSGAVPTKCSDFQLTRASELISNILDFNDRLNSQAIPVEFHKSGTPLCMNQYKLQFGTTRIPKKDCDEVVSMYPNNTKHITVMVNNQIYKLDVYKQDGQRESKNAIKAKLINIANHSESRQMNLQPPVGILTATNRDTWAQARSDLIDLGGPNPGNFHTIDTSLFSVSLDNLTEPENANSLDYRSSLFLKGEHGHNRWFDKSIQLLILNTGDAGLNCEHTPVDANTTGRIISEALVAENKSNSYQTGLEPEEAVLGQAVEHLQWIFDGKLSSTIQNAADSTRAFADSVNLETLDFSEFGGDVIKSNKISPDSFVQMAIQLAYYRLHNEPCPTYEAAATRNFSHGRTECVRVCSNESLAFTNAFLDDSLSKQSKQEALQQALASHKRYMTWASNANGVDRHLLGLKCQMTPLEADKGTLFNDPAFGMSYNYKLSTSNVSPARLFRGGFAPVVPNGYGVAYGIDKNVIRLVLSTWNNPETSLPQFKASLSRSLSDINRLVS